jgi:glycosyltransferase involved in cell wall biosynthesis
VTDRVASQTGLHVLAYGELDSGVTDALRLGIFREPLRALGVEVRPWHSFADDALVGGGGGLTAIEWADVILFRRWRPTHIVCTECETAFVAIGDLERHVRRSGHRTMVPDLLLRPILNLLEAHPELIASRAIVYDTDDDVLRYPDWTGFARAAERERDTVLQVLRLADLVTVATPVLAERMAAHTRGQVRVVRNALDPSWYEAATSGGERRATGRGGAAHEDEDATVRVVYHGVPVRLRDYDIARPAVDEVAADASGLRRIWLGAAEEPRIAAAMDEVRPWVDGLPEFAGALVAARPDVGLAPLLDEPFNRAKSELHWLEYSLAGAATIVSGFDGVGPYDVVRDGVDGLVAREPGDWERNLRALVASPQLRAELAGRARERVVAEYSSATRALEWADAYRWAAENAGLGRRSRVRVIAAAKSPRPEASPTRVLVLGPGEASASDALRFVAMAPPLARFGVELACWSPTEVPDAAAEFEILGAVLSMANVVVLRRSYRTYHSCLACPLRTLDRTEIRGHAEATGHDVVESPFALVRPLVGLLEAEPGALGGRAIVYDTDDDLFSADLPAGAEDLLERDLVERILGLADLVTATTPLLAGRLAGRTKAPVRVIRNALDPSWYGPRNAGRGDRPAEEVRVVHHGSAARLAEYEVARPAVDTVARETPGMQRVWVGSTDARIRAAVDEARPWVQGLPEFANALAEARPDIGIAPLRDTPYNRCRSELHWLEYSLAGAATIASGFAGPGPYDPIRDGVDGLIARDASDWQKHLRALAGSADLRANLAGNARERVISGYSPIGRAAEWADAYKWVVENRRPLA